MKRMGNGYDRFMLDIRLSVHLGSMKSNLFCVLCDNGSPAPDLEGRARLSAMRTAGRPESAPLMNTAVVLKCGELAWPARGAPLYCMGRFERSVSVAREQA